MLKLYHCNDARSFRALWALEEVGAEYELIVMKFPPRYRAKEFMEENPLGTIPLLIDGQTRMTESAAICEYLAAKFPEAGIHVSVDDPAYGAYLNAMHQGEATLTFPQTLVLRYAMFEPEERRQPQVAEDYGNWFLARLNKSIAPILETSDYVAANRFTAADISVAYALQLAKSIGRFADFPPHVEAYWERMQSRPAFQAAKAAQKDGGGKAIF